MSVRPHPTKEGWYIIDYRPNGRNGARVRIPFEGSEDVAMKYEMELRKQHRSESTPNINPRIGEIIPDFIAAYTNDHQPQTVSSVLLSFKHLSPVFWHLQFTALTPTLIEQYKAKRLTEGVKKRTVNKELAYFSAIAKYAVENRVCNPLPFKIKGFPPKQAKAPIPIIPTPEEVQAILDNMIGDDKKGLFIMMYDGGLRKTEASTIQAEKVDLAQGILFVTGKGDKERIVPITTERQAAELARKLEESQSGYLYINKATKRPFTSIRLAIIEAAKRAKVNKRVYNHLLRHAHGTHALVAGVNLRALQGSMGHSSSQTTERYTHLAAQYLKGEMGKFGASINAVIPHGTQKQPVEACR